MGDPRPGDFPRYLERALDLLAREAPIHFAATRDRLAGRAAVIRVGGAPAARVCLAGAAPPFVTRVARGDGADGDVAVALSPRDLGAFLRGELTIEEGIDAGRLAVRGRLDDVLALLDALASWLHGALRCPSFPALHDEYLNGKGAIV